MTTFYIARHGETEWNVLYLMQGQKNSILTTRGIRQARELAKELKPIKFDYIFSSDLLRAKKTAQIIALEHKLVVSSSKLLREKKFGVYEGKSEAKMEKELKKEVELMNSLSTKNRMKYRLHSSFETDDEAISRLLTFLRQTSLAYPDKNILIVAHGGIMRTLLIHLGAGDYKNFPRGSIKNGGYIVLQSDGIEFFIKHLYGIKITSVVNT